MPIVIDHANLSSGFNINELTSGTLDGNGVFDVLMKSVSEHLGREFANNRMRGTDYANAYVQAMNNALNQACGYALQKTKQPLEIQLMEAQLQKMAVDTGLVIKQGALIDAQASREMSEIAKTNHELQHLFPVQVELAKAELQLKQENIKLAQKELGLKDKQIQLAHAELGLKEKQLELAVKELALKDKELVIKDKELELRSLEIQLKLPAEIRNANAQASLYEQKVITEQAQTNAGVIGSGSVIDSNNKVLQEQAKTYVNDIKIKVMNSLIDTWKIRFTEDPNNNAVSSTSAITDPNIGRAVNDVLNSTGIS